MPPSTRTEARRKARDLFKQLDANNDESLTREEVVSGLEDMGAADMGYQLFEVLDTNGDGKVTAKEFVEGYEVWQLGVLRGSAGVGKRDSWANYRVCEQLAKGTTGTIQRVEHTIEGREYACKTVYKSTLRDRATMDAFRQELTLHQGLKHSHIVELKDVFETPDECHMVLELCAADLISVLAEADYTERNVARLVKMLFDAVQHCHSQNIMHRDIRAENLLLTNATNLELAELKLMDFGCAKKLRGGTQLRDLAGAPAYAAPEMLEGTYGLEADVWSCGVVMFFMLSGELPFASPSILDLYHEIINEELDFRPGAWIEISEEAKILLRSMLCKDPSKRATLKECLESEWIAKFSEGERPNNLLAPILSTNAKKFACMTRLKKQVYKMCAEQLSSAHVLELHRAFKEVDLANSGHVQIRSFMMILSGMNGIGEVAKDLQLMVEAMDVDGDGFIDYAEFLSATTKQNVLLTEQSLQKAFKAYDADGSGSITVQELKAGLELQNKGNSEVKFEELLDILLATDRNGDGLIDYEEFMDEMVARNNRLMKDVEAISTSLRAQAKEMPWQSRRRHSAG